MKELKRETAHVEYYTEYEAWDGELFSTAEECKKYENSAAAVLMSKLDNCMIIKNCSSEMLEGSDENMHKTVVPQSETDIDTLNQLWFMFGGEGKETPIFFEEHIGLPVIIGYRIYKDHYEWVWFYKLNDEIKTLTNGKYILAKSKETENQ